MGRTGRVQGSVAALRKAPWCITQGRRLPGCQLGSQAGVTEEVMLELGAEG